MKWFILNCILLACVALTLAKNDNIRPKRDLSYLKGFLKSIIGGQKNIKSPVLLKEGENFKLFRIPGFKNVLVKAIRKKPIPLEANVPTSVNSKVYGSTAFEDQTATIVGSYLGTKNHNETLHALQGMKNLLQSGILDAKSETLQRIGLIGSSLFNTKFKPDIRCVKLAHGQLCKNIKDGRKKIVNNGYIFSSTSGRLMESYNPTLPKPVALMPMPHLKLVSNPTIVEGMESVLIGIPPTPLPSYSYKQIHRDGHTTTYTAHEDQNVKVKTLPKPVAPMPTPNMKIIPRPTIVEDMESVLIGMPPMPLPNYSYKQIHRDGHTTTYTAHEDQNVKVKAVAPMPTPHMKIIPRPTIVEDMESVLIGMPPMPLPNYSYKQIHRDGHTTTYTAHEDQNVKVKPVAPMPTPHMKIIPRPTIVEDMESVLIGMPPMPLPNYSYKQIHRDGHTTTYTAHEDQNVKVKPVAPMPTPHMKIIPRPNIVEDMESVLIGIPPMPLPSYSYKQIHRDGYTTTYTGHDDQNVMVETTNEPKIKDSLNLVDSTVQVTAPILGNGNVLHIFQNVPQVPIKEKQPFVVPSMRDMNNYSYKQIHKDGSITTYTGDSQKIGVYPFFTKPGVKISTVVPALVTDRIDQITAAVLNEKKPNHMILTGPKPNINSFLHQENGNGLTSLYKKEKGNINVIRDNHINQIENITKPNGGSFLYKTIHKDGTVTSYSSSGVIEEVENPGLPHIYYGQEKATHQMPVIQASINTAKDYKNDQSNTNLLKNTDSYLYKTVHKDGSVTSYLENGIIDKKMHETPVSSNYVPKVNTNTAAVYPYPVNVPEVNNTGQLNSASGTFSYKTIHNDGSATNHIGDKIKVDKITEEKFGIMHKKNNLHTNDANNANFGQFSYKRIHNDSSVTNYFGNSEVEDSKDTQTLNYNNENVLKHNLYSENKNNLYTSEKLFLSNAKPHEDFGSLSYKTVHSDGSIRNYPVIAVGEDSGKIPPLSSHQRLENRSETGTVKEKSIQVSSMVNSEPLNVLRQFTANTYESPQSNNNPSLESSAFSYKTIHNDGSVTSYSGSGLTEENKDGSSLHNTQIGNLESGDTVNYKISGNTNYLNNINLKGSTTAFTYKVVHNDNSVTDYSRENAAGDSKRPISPVINTALQNNEAKTEVDNKIPYKLDSNAFSYKAKHNDGSVTKYTSTGVFTEENDANPVIMKSNTGSVISQINCNPVEKQPTVPVINNLDKIVIPALPIKSRYVYKQVHNNVPNNYIANEKNVPTNKDGESSTIQFPSSVTVPLPLKPSMDILSSTEKNKFSYTQVTNTGVYVNNDGLTEFKPEIQSSKPDENIKIATKADDLSDENSLSKKPIVVLDESTLYSYTQKKTDGSSVSIEKNRENGDVAVNINGVSKEASRNRGDIPEILN